MLSLVGQQKKHFAGWLAQTDDYYAMNNSTTSSPPPPPTSSSVRGRVINYVN